MTMWIDVLISLIAFVAGGVMYYLFNKYFIQQYVSSYTKKQQTLGKEVLGVERILTEHNGYEPIRDKLFIILGSVCCGVCYNVNGSIIHKCILFLFLSALAIISIINLDILLVPNRYIIFVIVLGIISLIAEEYPSFNVRMVGVLSLSVPFFIFSRIIKDSFGIGDIKIIASSGFLLGWERMMLGAVIATFAAVIYGVLLIFVKKKKINSTFAFGPFLCLGLAISAILDEVFIWNLREYIYSTIELIH